MGVVVLNLAIGISTFTMVVAAKGPQENVPLPSPPPSVSLSSSSSFEDMLRDDSIQTIRRTINKLFLPKDNKTQPVMLQFAQNVASYLLPVLSSGHQKSGYPEYENYHVGRTGAHDLSEKERERGADYLIFDKTTLYCKAMCVCV